MRQEYEVELSDEELVEGAQILLNLFRNVLNSKRRRLKMERGLILHPEGYEIHEYQGRCGVCRTHPSQTPHWVDKTGVKCAPCYKSFKRRAIPQIAATDRNSWYDEEDLRDIFLIGPKKIYRLIQERVLVAREIKGSGFLLFMCADNPTFLPPRSDMRLLEELSQGKEWYEVFDPWRSLEGFGVLLHSNLPKSRLGN